ncbi:MAG TPA: glycosyltransferase [Allocoleopsis sp.]
MLLDFTVVIPTYNGASRLPEVLELLRSQLNTDNIHWEIIINNNSTDNTAEIAKSYQLNWHKKYSLRYDFEPQQGAGFARKKAIEIANSNLIGFLDDDNLPEKNWVFAAYNFAQKYPQAGAYGSQIYPLYTVNLPLIFIALLPISLSMKEEINLYYITKIITYYPLPQVWSFVNQFV